MKREILFRGKRLDQDTWIKGYLIKNERTGQWAIKPYDPVNNPYEKEIDPNTIGQYTGLKDKNGTKIFEGDTGILSLLTEFGANDTRKLDVVVLWHDGSGYMWSAGWVFDRGDGKYESFCCDEKQTFEDMEITGNIHEKQTNEARV